MCVCVCVCMGGGGGGGGLDIFSLVCLFFFFPLSETWPDID